MSTASEEPGPQTGNGHAPVVIQREVPDVHGTSALSRNESAVLVDAVARAARIGLVLRTMLFGGAVIAGLMALLYTWRRGDAMVDAILSGDREVAPLGERLLTLTLPVLLLVFLGAMCVIGAAVLQSRALDERERALDAIARVRRETESGASRMRTLARLAEDDLTHARREYLMQLAFGRGVVVLAGGMIICAISYSLAVGDVDRYTLAFGGGAVVPWLLGVVLDLPTKIARNLFALSQRHLIVAAFAREVGVIEAHAYRDLGRTRRQGRAQSDAEPRAFDSAEAIDSAVERAVWRIQHYCKGGDGAAA
jgi:hypothetical protein